MSSYINTIIKKIKVMYEIVNEFVCGISGIECVIVNVYGEELCFEANNLMEQIVEALRVNR